MNKIEPKILNAEGTKVRTGEVRFSYANVFEPKAMEGSTDKKYSVCLVIPKSDKKTIKAVKSAIQKAADAGLNTKFGGKPVKKVMDILKDGDEERPDDDTVANCYFINANAKTKPGVVYRNLQPITDTTDFYSGCYGLASVNFYAFNANGNKGVACGLNNLVKLRDGEFLGGRASAEDDFADLDLDDLDDVDLDDIDLDDLE